MSTGFEDRGGRFHCEDVSVTELVAELGTPLYVYSSRNIRERFRAFDRAFEPLDRLIAYSVKANGNLSILALLAELGAGADIVSGGELYRARRAGIAADRIVFSGVGKTEAELDAALHEGIYGFNVESEGELRALSRLASAVDRPAPVALRINPDVVSPTPHRYTRTGHRATKFGVPAERALELYRLAAGLPGVDPVGIDVHIGSQISEPAPYEDALLRVLDIVGDLREEGIELRYIDLGGGFAVSYDDAADPDIARFAERIVPHLATSPLRLVLEPGRYLVGHAGVLLTRVLYVKDMGPKTFVITDAGMNDLIRPSHYASYHRVQSARHHDDRERVRCDVVGPICESGDFLAVDREMPRPEPGELLVIRTAGAYGFVMASTYNARPRPAEVLVDGDTHRVIRRRETLEDLVRGETMPAGGEVAGVGT